jgi:hypothetical protein
VQTTRSHMAFSGGWSVSRPIRFADISRCDLGFITNFHASTAMVSYMVSRSREALSAKYHAKNKKTWKGMSMVLTHEQWVPKSKLRGRNMHENPTTLRPPTGVS